MMVLTRLTGLLVSMTLGVSLAALAGEPAKAETPGAVPAAGNVERKGPLASLPSAPGPHLEKIKALGDNQWVNLGSPAADPKWGTACGRSWGGKALVFAPDLRGAFLSGEGQHAHVKPDGHAMDDWWFYDINAHRWICLYPGMNPKTFVQRIKDKDLTVDGEGRLVDKDGQPIPVHTLGHAYGFMSYDTDQKKLAFYGGEPRIAAYILGGLNDMRPGMVLLTEQGFGKYDPINGWKSNPKGQMWSLWFYDPLTGRFDLQPATGSTAPFATEIAFPLITYIPSKKQYLALSSGFRGTAVEVFYDPAQRKWGNLPRKGPGLAPNEAVGCHDSKRDRIYHGLVIYDVATGSWTDPKAEGDHPSELELGSSCSGMEYDTVNDVVVVIQFRGGEKHKAGGVFIYDPKKNTWSGPSPLPAGMAGAANICYDPELNVHFIYVAGDSAPGGAMYAYRYKRAQEQR